MAEYIERESLLEIMRANFQQGSWYGCDEPMYPIVEETILEAPAADVAPVVHGRWIPIPEYDNKRCSACKMVFSTFELGYYCPYCGAKMDKEADHAQ